MNGAVVGVILMSSLAGFGLSGVAMERGSQPVDGLQPPPGPVSDTQPSLASLSEQLSQLAVGGGLGFPPGIQVVDVPPVLNSTETVLSEIAGPVRLYAWTTGGGQAELLDSNGSRVAIITGASWRASDMELLGFSQMMLGGLEVQPPLTVRSSGPMTASDTFIYYWIDEDGG